MISEKIRTEQGMEGARRATGIPCSGTAPGAHSMPSLPLNPPDPEVPEKAVPRRFTAEYKLNIKYQTRRRSNLCSREHQSCTDESLYYRSRY